MGALTLLDRRFVRPPDFTTRRRPLYAGRDMIVRALFDRETARWVRESRSFYTAAEEDVPDGLLVTLTVRQERVGLQWLLRCGPPVPVLAPGSLRQGVSLEAPAHQCPHHTA